MLTIDVIRGLKVGLEYVDLDDDDRETFGFDHTMMIVLDLAFVRFTLFNGQVETE